MIYCSYSWWSERGLSSVPINVQVRPTLAEAARLAGPVGFGTIKAFEKMETSLSLGQRTRSLGCSMVMDRHRTR
jgi:hypothetical protein